MNLARTLSVSLGLTVSLTTGHATPTFVNGLVIPATTLDASGGIAINDGRFGFFSDIYYDANENVWYALSDRGPGGGTLNYETRISRFSLDVNTSTGAISNFQILSTTIFRDGAVALNGLAPAVGDPLGFAFDPEGVVVSPKNGHLLISDEYGPSLYEINKPGQVVRGYQTPANLVPRDADGNPNFAINEDDNIAGKRTNRGFEGLAVSPDGRFVYAMLQSAMLDEGAGNGTVNRIVKFSTGNGRAVAQYAYVMAASSQGRGVSALVAINDHEFLALERNNRGLGVDGELTPINKKVFRIDLNGASDVSNVDLDSGTPFTPVTKTPTAWLDLALPATLADASLASLGGLSPEKWEGLAIGPQLADGSYLVLTGTDNDFSVSQDPTSVQFEIYFKPTGTPVRIRCDLGKGFTNCRKVNVNGSVGDAVPSDFDFNGYQRIPGVLHAYKASAADLSGLVRPRN